MRVIVSYDITDDAIRRQIEKVCKAFGQRVQRSVFECALSNEQVKDLVRRLDIMRTNGDVSRRTVFACIRYALTARLR